MRVVQRAIYYCDHCGQHRITRRAIENHEPVCMLNPDRRCRWRIEGHPDVHAGVLAAEIAARDAAGDRWADWLREQTGGCPGCMLAAVRQSGLGFTRREDEGFDYQAEVDRLRGEEAATARGDLW